MEFLCVGNVKKSSIMLIHGRTVNISRKIIQTVHSVNVNSSAHLYMFGLLDWDWTQLFKKFLLMSVTVRPTKHTNYSLVILIKKVVMDVLLIICTHIAALFARGFRPLPMPVWGKFGHFGFLTASENMWMN